ncbi:MAG: Rho termination factor [Alphaproteobacteria bacterium HGW-Alphaproteobacteria-16]|nr:MAG: Rho termination factor [Alphaproteobacteria bacterium HGW-Alphaproteobacteria-16]
MAKDHGPQVKDDETYEALRKDGASKEKAARIANAKADDSLDHDSTHLENRTKDELYDQAKEIGIDGRSDMTKDELIKAIRQH